MEMIYKSLHNLDMDKDTPIRKQIPVDFNSYMEAYIKFATSENDSSRDYEPIDTNRTVLMCVSSIIKGTVLLKDDKAKHDSLSDSIALKLLDVEKAVQERIGKMTEVQKGSIVQSLILDDGEYKFVIAKVEHAEWYDGETLEKNFGFPGKNKRVWKSAVIGLNVVEDDVIITSIKVYVNNNAKYWTEDFLEVKETKTDAANTKAVMHTVESVLKPIKNISMQDYYNLRNTVVHELQSGQIISYPDMICSLLDTYEPTSENVNVHELKEKLLIAHEKGKFDTLFQTDPKSIKGQVKITIPISLSIEVIVKEGIPNWKDEFLVHEKSDGRKYLMIRCDNEQTLSSFPRDKEWTMIQ